MLSGESLCYPCSDGIAPRAGSTECETCPATQFATEDRKSCGCPPGRGLRYPSGALASGHSMRLSISEGDDFEAPRFEEQGFIEGRLELKYGRWGTLRESIDYTYPFTANEAIVACRQLGRELGFTTISAEAIPYYETPDGTVDCIADDLDCDGTESNLGDCLTLTSLVCQRDTNHFDVGVRCQFASLECYNCEPGTFSSSTLLSACDLCPKDSFGPDIGAVECNRCPFGQKSAKGSTKETQCFSTSELFSGLFVTVESKDGSPVNQNIRTFDGTISRNISATNLNNNPSKLVFRDPTNFVLLHDSELSGDKHDVYQYKTDGKLQKHFATFDALILDVLFMDDIGIIAVACKDGNVYFFDHSKKPITGILQASESDSKVFIELGVPVSLERGLKNDEVYVTVVPVEEDIDSIGEVLKVCMPGERCGLQGQTQKVIDKGKFVAVDRVDGSLFVLNQESSQDIICRCNNVSSIVEQNTASACEVVVSLPSLTYEISHFSVDSTKKVIYVLCGSLGLIFVYDYSTPAPLNPLENPTNNVLQIIYPVLANYEELGGMYFRPGFAIETSTIALPTKPPQAGSEIALRLNLYDQVRNLITAEGDTAEIIGGIYVAARGQVPTQVPGLMASVDLMGDSKLAVYNITNTTTKVHTVDALLTLNIATSWQVSIQGTNSNNEKQHLFGSPYVLNVTHSYASAENCAGATLPRTASAGDFYEASFRTFDRFSNPTENTEYEEMKGTFSDSTTGKILNATQMKYDPLTKTFVVSKNITQAGEYELQVDYKHDRTVDEESPGDEIGGSPFRFTITPAEYSVEKTSTSLETMIENEETKGLVHDSKNGEPIILKVEPRDRFDNFIPDAEGWRAWISDGTEEMVKDLTGPAYEYKIEVEKGQESKMFVGFLRPEGTGYLGMTRSISIQVIDPINVPVEVAVGVAAGVILIFIGIRYFTSTMMNRRMLNMKLSFEKNESAMRMEMAELHESLMKQKHSEAEIEVMKKALEEMEQEREDELRSVLIDSNKITIVSLLGQGAFGTVSLATYSPGEGEEEQQVAVKQLLNIDDESIERFRFECFLTKELRHPNVVRLVGVCWDEMMLGCCLEYIDGGSLEDRLRKDWTLPKEEKMTWKGVMLKLAIQAAMGVQYLHHSQYYDEKAKEMKDCIIHRDLKPDNMLVTKAPDNVLKLTDFGEARAQELNMTMTAVGTPIYISPEVMSNDRYDRKADTYSFGVILLAMIRAEKNIIDYYFGCLMRKLNRKTKIGIGVASLNRHLEEGWTPPIPKEFYPKFSRLIASCMNRDPVKRPDFDYIKEKLTGDIHLEVSRNDEPVIGSGKRMYEDGLPEGEMPFDADTGRSFLSTTDECDTGRSYAGIDRGDDTDSKELVVKLTMKNNVLEKENRDFRRMLEARGIMSEGKVTGGRGELKKEQPTIASLTDDDDVKVRGELRKEEPTIVVLPGQANTEGDGGDEE